ncbi:MAG: DNA repair protein RecO [Proteobacteria bacterium]|nr:DNA repair protein RecO [Pseudomonadota bacterium]MBS0464582.1 DNA repair protein RecO [Pseudomonadota bacterium]
MRVLDQPAIVLHASRWRETSLLVEAFTHEHGRVGLLARGVTGPRKQPLRAALQPLQRVRIDYAQRGELAQLTRAEVGATAPMLGGEALLAGLYLCELTLRMLPRDDAHPTLFLRFAQALDDLVDAPSLAWTLRRFERDLLGVLGFAPELHRDVHGGALDPLGRYRVDPEHGPLRVADSGAGVRGAIRGAALLALADEAPPSAELLREQRLALRQIIAHHLGGRGLRSWGLLAEFAELVRDDRTATVQPGK